MARFCDQCGRPLEEGEVCNCTKSTQEGEVSQSQGQFTQAGGASQSQGQFTQAGGAGQSQGQFTQAGGAGQSQGQFAQAGGAVQMQQVGNIQEEIAGVFKGMGNMFLKPVQASVEMAQKNSLVSGIIMSVINIVAVALMSAIYLGVFASRMDASLPIVKMVFLMMLFAAVFDFGLAGILTLTTHIFFGDKTTYQQMLSVVGVKVFVDTAFLIVGVLISLLIPSIGFFILIIGGIFSAIAMTMSLSEILTLPSEKKFYALYIAAVIIAIIMSILIYMGVRSVVMDMVEMLMSSMLGGLGGFY